MTIRRIDESSVAVMLDWAEAEGWNPGVEDAAAFFATDPAGFFGLYVDDELAATISAVRYDASFGFVGFYICRPEYRGQGLGLQLFQAALAELDATTVGLDGVVEQEPNYARSGFVAAHRSARFGGRLRVASNDGAVVRRLRPSDIDGVLAYERNAQVFPAPRRAFLERWLASSTTTAFCVGAGDRIDGYGAIRQCVSGFKIGPLFCEHADDAEILVSALVHAVSADNEVFLDVPQPNVDGTRFARELGLEPTFETVRMYRGPDPAIALDRVFGVTTFELG